jgi:hypothetical protein
MKKFKTIPCPIHDSDMILMQKEMINPYAEFGIYDPYEVRIETEYRCPEGCKFIGQEWIDIKEGEK